jgi:rhodanese-related sulfurtransferase
MSSPYLQPLDPAGAPSPLTPADSPSDPSGFAGVTPHGQGPAPYDIQAPMADLSGAFEAAGAANGAGIVYPASGRQAATESLLSSAQGYGDFSILAGSAEGWPADVTPSADPDNGGYGGA